MQKEEGRRSETVKFRVTIKELYEIDSKAYELGLSRSEYLRRACVNKEITIYDFSGLNRLTADIGKIGTNVNQIARKLNMGGQMNKENAAFLKISIEAIHRSIEKIYQDVAKKPLERGG